VLERCRSFRREDALLGIPAWRGAVRRGALERCRSFRREDALLGIPAVRLRASDDGASFEGMQEGSAVEVSGFELDADPVVVTVGFGLGF
jgi:hypothetical protein